MLAGVAIAGAVYFASLKLDPHGHIDCTPNYSGGCVPGTFGWKPKRATWQIPIAIVIAAVGIGAAVAVARRA